MKFSEKVTSEMLGILNKQMLKIFEHRKTCIHRENHKVCTDCCMGLEKYVRDVKREI